MLEFILYYTHCDEKIKFLKLKAFFYYWDYLLLLLLFKSFGNKKDLQPEMEITTPFKKNLGSP